MSESNNEENVDLCGEETTSGEPCKNPAESCPWNHGGDNPNGDKPEFGDEQKEAAINAAKRGVSQAGCARATGFDESTLRDHLKKDSDFARDFTIARSEGEQKIVQGGMYRETVNSSFAKFLLSTSFDYVKTERRELEHSGEVDGFDFTIEYEDDSGD